MSRRRDPDFPSGRRRRPDPDPCWIDLPIPIHLDRGPVMLRFSCVQCGTLMPATLEPEEILRQLEADGRVTIERACPRCEQIITVFLAGATG